MFSLTWSQTKYISSILFHKWKHNNAKTSLKQLFLFIVFFFFFKLWNFSNKLYSESFETKNSNSFSSVESSSLSWDNKNPNKMYFMESMNYFVPVSNYFTFIPSKGKRMANREEIRPLRKFFSNLPRFKRFQVF